MGGMAIASGGGWRFWRLTYRGRVTPPPNLCVRLDLEKIDILEKGVSKIGKKLNFEGLNSRQILGVTPSIEKKFRPSTKAADPSQKILEIGLFPELAFMSFEMLLIRKCRIGKRIIFQS
jgi:hypothetical protein